MKKTVIISLFFIANLAWQFAYAQSNIEYLTGNYGFVNYGARHGLVGLQIVEIFQDSKGYLWVGTHGGLSKFDGKNFTNYTDKNGLAGNAVYGIAEDTMGNMWFGTMKGLSRFDGKSFFNYNKENGLPSPRIWDIIITRKKEIWLATSDGLFKVKIRNIEKNEIEFEYIQFKELEPQNNIIRDIVEDDDGNFWLGTEVSVLKYYPLSGKVEKIIAGGGQMNGVCVDRHNSVWAGGWGPAAILNYKNNKISTALDIGSPFNALLADSRGNIWAGSWDKGLFKYDGKKWISYTVKNGLPINSIWSLFEDKEGNIWVGTFGGGLSKFTNEKIVHFTQTNGLVNNQVSGIIQDKKNNFWFSTDEGISMFNPRLVSLSDNGFINYTKSPEGEIMTKMRSVSMDSAGVLWFTSYGGWTGKYENGKFQGMDSMNAEFCSYIDKNDEIWIGGDNHCFKYGRDKKRNQHFEIHEKISEVNRIISILQDKQNNMWFGSMAGGVNIYNGKTINNYSRKQGFTGKPVQSLLLDESGNIWAGTAGDGIFKCRFVNDKIKILDSITMNDGLSSDEIAFLIFDKKKNLWIGTNKGINKFDFKEYSQTGKKKIKSFGEEDGLKSIDCSSAYLDNDGNLWFGTSEGAVRFNTNDTLLKNTLPFIHITDIKLSLEKVNWENFTKKFDKQTGLPLYPDLSYKDNHLTFQFTGISFTAPEKIKYSYILEGSESQWSPLVKDTKVTFANLSHGTYTFKVKAMNGENLWSLTPASFQFVITPPWWKTKWFYALSITVLILGTFFFIRIRERNLRREKAILEEKVKQRTLLIQQQKNEIQNQKTIVEEKNKDIIDSINYAKRIQDALLKEEEHVSKHLPDHFILFKPKDIVSGDFYWSLEKTLPSPIGEGQGVRYWYLAAVDCTGHGVPGAFMSMLGIAFLNEITATNQLLSPAEILDQLRDKIVKELGQSGKAGQTKDGMDISLMRLNLETMELQWAGANNPLWVIRRIDNGTSIQHPTSNIQHLIEIKPNKQPIGYHLSMQPFTNHVIKLEAETSFYLFTDGYADQFGGEKEKKFMYSKLKELLLSIHDKPMPEQKEILNTTFENWKRSLEQVDDVCVIGIRL